MKFKVNIELRSLCFGSRVRRQTLVVYVTANTDFGQKPSKV